MRSINWVDVLVRAFKTFIQAAVAVLVATDNPFSKAALVAAAAAGISAVWNTIREFVVNTA